MAHMFKGKTALVTGAGRGLGRAIAVAFAGAGADVSVVDIDQKSAQETAKLVRAQGTKCLVIREDISSSGAGERIVRETVTGLGGLHILVNNAGVPSVEPFLEITESEWDRVFAVNVRGLLFCLQAAAKSMRGSGGGKIINITSPASRMGLPNYTAYAASKAAVDSITRCASIALAKYNINVNSVAPGRMDTEMQRVTEEKFAALEGVDLETFVRGRTENIPLRRRTAPEEIAQIVLWLASRQADYVTSHRLNASGGVELG